MIIGRPISSSHFDYTSDDKTFIADASEIKGFPFTGRLYDDSADVGFVLTSARTGSSQAYFLHEVDYNYETGILHWEFRPAHPIRPGAEGTKVLIMND